MSCAAGLCSHITQAKSLLCTPGKIRTCIRCHISQRGRVELCECFRLLLPGADLNYDVPNNFLARQRHTDRQFPSDCGVVVFLGGGFLGAIKCVQVTIKMQSTHKQIQYNRQRHLNDRFIQETFNFNAMSLTVSGDQVSFRNPHFDVKVVLDVSILIKLTSLKYNIK